MGKCTEYFDYLTRDPWWIGQGFCEFNYFHMTVGPEEKKLRRKLRWYVSKEKEKESK